MKQIDGGVTAAKGFEAAGTEAAVKYRNRKDMALIYSTSPCRVAGTFTSNVVKAAPVRWDQKVVAESPYAQAVVVNSGIANACTGQAGMDCCRAEAECAGKLLGIPAEAVLESNPYLRPLEGSGVAQETLEGLLGVDKALWAEEAKGIREYYAKFGDKLPKELLQQLDTLENNLK